MAEYYETYLLFDKDGDGKVTASELGIVFRSVGQRATADDLREIVKDMDDDG